MILHRYMGQVILATFAKSSLTLTTIIRMLARVQRSNTGAPQGDSLSPALYVIYMEVVPLQLERYIGTILSRRNVPICHTTTLTFIDESKMEHTSIHRKNTLDVDKWRKTRKLGSLLGDVEDVTRRKQLAAVAFQRLWPLWIRKRNISEGICFANLTTPHPPPPPVTQITLNHVPS